MNNNHLSQLRFDNLELHDEILRGILDVGFKYCTPIQAQTLPIALNSEDVAGQAQTGTGKTAAFLIAAYQYILNNEKIKNNPKKIKQPRIFILAPTRELAIQISSDAKAIGKYTKLKVNLAFGGTGYEKQKHDLEAGTDILVGTPGRIIDYFKKGVFKLNEIQVVILDEADRMFDLGFIKDIRYLLRRLPDPEKRLNMLFSATLSHRVMELAYEHMNDPKLIQIKSDTLVTEQVRQAIFFPSNKEKIPLLIGLIKEMSANRIMVFVNTKREAEKIENWFQVNNIEGKAISGDVPQKKRINMLKRFQDGELPVLIATDVASRGLHIPNIKYVINFDLPQDREDYVHRVGRTARAGASGDAISFGCETYAMHLPDIEEYIKFKIPVANFDPALLPKLNRPMKTYKHFKHKKISSNKHKKYSK